MARGWESKQVEAQREAAEAEKRREARRAVKLSDLDRERQRESLALSIRRVQNDLKTAQNPRYREQLQKALAFLEGEISKLG